MKNELTHRFLKSLKPPEFGRLEVSDSEHSGLWFPLSADGKAVWMYEKRVKVGLERKHTLGTWPEPMNLSQARATALEIEAETVQGIDRTEVQKEERRKAALKHKNTMAVSQVIETYDDLHLSSLRTHDECPRQLRQSLSVHLDEIITHLIRADIRNPVDAKAESVRKA